MPSGKSSAIITVISLMVTIIGTFIGLPFLYDFSVSVNSMRVDVNPEDIAHISVEVNPGWLYNEDISLRAESVPSSIHLNIEPQILEHGSNSVSTVTISAEKDASPGEYLISLIGDGSDGKEHTCKLTLNVDGNNVDDNESISINTREFDLEPSSTSGSISVSSSPSGANIYLDEVYQGETPEVLDNIEQGSHTVKLKLAEYEDWPQTVSVSAGKTISVSPTLTSSSTSTPSAEIEDIWVEHNVLIDSLNGMAIHVKFDTLNLKDEKCSCIAYFYLFGQQLEDYNQECCDYAGNVCSGDDFTPADVDSVNDIIILIPYNELHMSPGTYNLEFNVVIWHENTELTISEMIPFVFTSDSYY